MNILLAGSFHGKNKGDEAIAYAEILFLQKAFPDCRVTVASQDPEYFRKAYESLHVNGVRVSNPFAMLRALHRAELLVIGGGGLFFEPKRWHIFHILRNQSLVWPIFMRIARTLKTPVLVWGVGTEPIHTGIGRRIIAWGLNGASGIIVRDARTRELFTAFGVQKEMVVLYDSAWLLAGRTQTNHASHSGRALRVGVSPHYGIAILENTAFVERYHTQFAEQLDLFAQRVHSTHDVEFVFVPMHRKDATECDSIRSYLSTASSRVDVQQKTPDEIIQLFQTMDLQVGMRMHGMILGTLAGIPSVSIIYAQKVKETVSFVFADSSVDPEDVSLSYTSIHLLADALYTAWKSHEAIHTHIGHLCRNLEQDSARVMDTTFRNLGLLSSTKSSK
jgi:polysaccharide pyruvyl transferase WcaK-like protein